MPHTGDNQILGCLCDGFKSTANVTGNDGNQGLITQDFICEDVPDSPGSCTATLNSRLVYNGYCPTPTPTPECDQQPTNCGSGWHWSFEDCGCVRNSSPIVIDISGDGFDLTNAENGVNFDLDSDGVREGLSWTSTGSDDAWLVLDRNQNGKIDNGLELFGNATEQPDPPAGEDRNGFLALAEFDKPEYGGNADGVISRDDGVFSRLRLWNDSDHNGRSRNSELFRLPQLGLRKIDLDYESSRRVDEFGNRFRWRSRVRDANDAQLGRWAWDVILTTE